uniref:SagB/ThcOx family dehydrogenase n=1 Tax=Fundidesulfovibrio putealis TaxID=270496 RepID=A0A7C4AGK7_9BACT
MNRRSFMGAAGAMAVGLGLGGTALAARESAALPPPPSGTGKSLEDALRARQSQRAYADRELSDEVLSGLLWAAFGVNRSATGGRTAPSARDRQEIEVHVTRRDGHYLYDAKKHALVKQGGGDIRALTGLQGYVAAAPVNLVYVADMEKAAGSGAEEKLLLAAADTGFISQNVYLYCAVNGLATVVRAMIDTAALAVAMGLAGGRRVMLAQCVGYPKG